MSKFLIDYERKRGRSMLYLNALLEKAEGFAKAERKPVRGEFDRNASQYVFNVPLQPVDPDWTLDIGEFVYNARASLNYLITGLVRSTGEEENGSNQFPIYVPDLKGGPKGLERISEWWDSAGEVGRQLKNTPPGTRAALKQLQPFYSAPRDNPFTHPLSALNLLSNRDKHRRLNLLARGGFIDFVDASGKPIFQAGSFPYRETESLEGDTYVVTFHVRPDYVDMDMYLLSSQQVSLHEPPELIGDLAETLSGIQKFIDRGVLPVVRSLL